MAAALTAAGRLSAAGSHPAGPACAAASAAASAASFAASGLNAATPPVRASCRNRRALWLGRLRRSRSDAAPAACDTVLATAGGGAAMQHSLTNKHGLCNYIV